MTLLPTEYRNFFQLHPTVLLTTVPPPPVPHLQHSTALVRSTRASSGSSNSIAAFHRRTDVGTCSSAFRNTWWQEIICQSKNNTHFNKIGLLRFLHPYILHKAPFSKIWLLVLRKIANSDFTQPGLLQFQQLLMYHRNSAFAFSI